MDPNKQPSQDGGQPQQSSGEQGQGQPQSPSQPADSSQQQQPPKDESQVAADKLKQEILGTSQQPKPDGQQAPQQQQQEPGQQQQLPGQPQQPPADRRDRRAERLANRIRRGAQQPPAIPPQQTQPNSVQGQPPTQQPYNPMKYDDGKQYSVEQIESDRQKFGESQFQQGIQAAQTVYQQEAWVDRLEIDGDRVASKYPMLDEESDGFNPDLAARINEMYLSIVGYDQNSGRVANPRIRYKDYVDSFMSVTDHLASSKNADSTKNLAQQAASGGVPPTGGTRQQTTVESPQDIRDMNDDAWEANREAVNSQILKMLS
jgi:hypothetical protein